MNASALRFLALGALLGAALFLSTPTARAIELGERAPDVEVNDTFNCEEFSLKELRGRLILFELFSTT